MRIPRNARRLSAMAACLAPVLLIVPDPVLADDLTGIVTGGTGSVRLLGQETGGGEPGRGGSEPEGGGGLGEPGTITIPSTSPNSTVPAKITEALGQGAGLCAGVPGEYRIDCMVQFFHQAARAAPISGAYSDAHRVLEDTANRLEKLVRENADRSKPSIRVQVSSGAQKVYSPRMGAIKPDAVATANAEAARIVAEAETMLLRSPGAAGPDRAEYVRIAEAVGSNKLLLRS